MTLTRTICPNHIALHASKQGARSAEVGVLVSVFEKSVTELKRSQKLLKCKRIVHIATLNIGTVNKISQLLELKASTAEHNIDIVCVQENRYHHSEVEIKYLDNGNVWTFIPASAWKNSYNAVIGVVGILFNARTLKSFKSNEKIQ